MPRNKFFLVYMIFIYFKSVFSSIVPISVPISVQSGSSVLDDQAQHKNNNIFGAHLLQGNSGGRYAAGYSHENENKHTVAQDSGGYNNVNNNRNAQDQAQQYFGEKGHRQNAGSASQFDRQGGHRKGHHKSGFQNSYHKEESENKSSFYDDSDDQGGHFVHNSQNGGFSSAGLDRNHGTRVDSHLNEKNNAARGGYNQEGNYDKLQGHKNEHNQRGYYDNAHNQGRQNVANAQGGAGRHSENNYYNQQPQYYPKYAPRRTITIYEDPRDLYSGQGYNNYNRGYEPYDAGLVHLNYRPNPYLQYPNNFNGYYY